MLFSLLQPFIFLPFLLPPTTAQSPDSGYIGYSLHQRGDPSSALYATDSTPTNLSTTVPPPDVLLNASVSVGEISLLVTNLTAKINLDAEVLQLLSFSAGVAVSIDEVSLLIQNVTAEVILEARLANLALMIDDVLSSLDLNPVLATLGQDVGQLVNTTVGGLTGSSEAAIVPRDYDLEHNVLYSVNDYSGHTHTNRILAQDGGIVDQALSDRGEIVGQKVVGSYARDMTFNGYNHSLEAGGFELQYVYAPFVGLSVVSAIFLDVAGKVVGTTVLSESSGGGSSTVG